MAALAAHSTSLVAAAVALDYPAVALDQSLSMMMPLRCLMKKMCSLEGKLATTMMHAQEDTLERLTREWSFSDHDLQSVPPKT